MFKVIQRDRDTNRQIKKRIYETTKSFNHHAFDICDRYVNWYKVEIYKQVDEEWILIKEFQDKPEFNRFFGAWKGSNIDTYDEALSSL